MGPTVGSTPSAPWLHVRSSARGGNGVQSRFPLVAVNYSAHNFHLRLDFRPPPLSSTRKPPQSGLLRPPGICAIHGSIDFKSGPSALCSLPTASSNRPPLSSSVRLGHHYRKESESEIKEREGGSATPEEKSRPRRLSCSPLPGVPRIDRGGSASSVGRLRGLGQMRNPV